MKKLLALFLAVSIFSPLTFAKDKKTLRIVSHELPPALGAKLPDGGALGYSLKKVLAKMGYDVELVFVSSWTRAKIMAKNDKTIDGYFPYATIENEDLFSFSEYFLHNPWVIAERKDKPIVWKKAEDLSKYVGGNVTGVELRPGVKELFEAGKLRIETTSSNEYNIQKLATKRVDYIFIDAFIFGSLVDNIPALRIYKDQLQVNAKPIFISQYGLAVRKGNVPKNFIKEFNKASPEGMSFALSYAERFLKKENKGP